MCMRCLLEPATARRYPIFRPFTQGSIMKRHAPFYAGTGATAGNTFGQANRGTRRNTAGKPARYTPC